MRPNLPLFALLLAAALSAVALPAPAETAMTAAEFEAYSTGKTLTYGKDGAIWGREQYLPERQVIWSRDEECLYGQWFEQSGDICFLYEGSTAPQCWRFFTGAAGIYAVYQDGGAGSVVTETGQSDRPLNCSPRVGA